MTETEHIPLIAQAYAYDARTALIDDGGRLTYRELLAQSARAATRLLDGARDLDGARVALFTPPGIDYVVWQWGIWRAGGIVVPLCTAHPAPELAYTLRDCGAAMVVCHAELSSQMEPIAASLGLRVVPTEMPTTDVGPLPSVEAQRGAMLLYTSGTTGKPKGVLSTHATLAAQIQSVVQAWEWSAEDHVLHTLPLHHLHGVLNVLCSALWAGAACEFLPRFDSARVWERIARGDGLTLFMAVPTMYAKLAQAFDATTPERRARMRAGCARLRLMVSGSSALPAAMLDRWHSVSGHTLLERYGMTEFGMGLGNPLHGERRAGHVGVPFPGIEVRLVDDAGHSVADGEPGEIQVRGAGVFTTYWERPDATREAFTADGWFRTGDVATRHAGIYRILGRESVDILKSGGFKISALEIEATLCEHPAVVECAVVGVPDDVWGQRIAAVIVLRTGYELSLDALRAWGKERLAPYKVPTLLKTLPELPKNAMGKVQKPELTALLSDPSASVLE